MLESLRTHAVHATRPGGARESIRAVSLFVCGNQGNRPDVSFICGGERQVPCKGKTDLLSVVTKARSWKITCSPSASGTRL